MSDYQEQKKLLTTYFIRKTFLPSPADPVAFLIGTGAAYIHMPSFLPVTWMAVASTLTGLATDYGYRWGILLSTATLGRLAAVNTRDFVYEYGASIKLFKLGEDLKVGEFLRESSIKISDDLIGGKKVGWAMTLGGIAGGLIGGFLAYQVARPFVANAVINLVTSPYHASLPESPDLPRSSNVAFKLPRPKECILG